MSYPGPGAVYRHCIMCGRPFRVWASELRKWNRAKFCCYGGPGWPTMEEVMAKAVEQLPVDEGPLAELLMNSFAPSP